MANSSPLPIAVLGGGVTGLTTAYTLAKRGHRVRLFEASHRLGGAVSTEITPDGWLVESGPKTMLLGSPALRSLIAELGLQPDLQTARPDAKHRFLVRAGELIAAPHSPGTLFSTNLFSGGAKLKLLTELLKRPRRRVTDISVSLLAEAHFGREILNYGVQPFVSGVYAGNPQKLSAKYAFPQLWDAEQTHGSIIRGLQGASRKRADRGEPKPGIVSFARGLQEIPDALGSRLPPGTTELGATAEMLIADGGWKLVWQREGVTETEKFAAVALALPAHALAKVVVGTLGERPLAGLEAMEYPPVSVVFLGYQRAQVRHPLTGFGVLVPAAENRDVLGILVSSTLFPGRAPDTHVALTVMLGGSLRPELGRLDAAAAVDVAHLEAARLLGIEGAPVFTRVRDWPRAIPQYNLGHERFLAAMAHLESVHDGLLVGGQARDGISLPACIESGLKLADRVERAARRLA